METSMRHFLFGDYLEGPADLPFAKAQPFLNSEVLSERVQAFSRVPVDEVLSLLERVGQRLTEPGRYRDRILETMPAVTGFSRSMVEKGVDVLEGLLSREVLEDRLACLGDRRALDGWTVSRGRPVRARPLGAICHVAAGNIFLGSVDSLVLGMITKNVNVLKISRQDPLFPFIFLEALIEEDREGRIASSIALTSWSHGNGEMMALAGSVFDGILLFGGEEAVKSYRQIASPGTEVLAFGPKLSWGLIREGLERQDFDQAVRGFALDAALWEQRACTSCQNLFVVGQQQAREVAERLHAELTELEDGLPQSRIDIDEAVDIRKERERVFWQSHAEDRCLFEGRGHTIILGKGADVIPSPLNRTVYVNAIDDWRQLCEGNLRHMAYYMSTAGVAAPPHEFDETLRALEPLGVLRFCLPGTMGLGADGEGTHDGVHLALGLVRLINREDLSPDLLGRHYDGEIRREERQLAELNRLVARAVRSPFYRDLYGEVKLPLDSLEEFGRLPVLEKKHLEAHCPPFDVSMLTAPAEGCYIFTTGGSSGEPRRICWTSAEFRQSLQVLGRGFRTLGIGPGNRVANIMKAGSLYTGFLAVNGGLEQTGCQILSMTANQNLEETLDLLEALKPDVAMAMTSTLVELAEKARDQRRNIRLERLFYTGETMPESSRELLRSVFGSSRVGSLSYGAVEIGPLGFQCDCCRHDEFHLAEDWAYLEFGDDGEVFATGTDRLLHPVIRYRIGDRAKWVRQPCGCGRKSPRFRLLGRSDYYVRLLYNDLFLVEIDRALARFPELTLVYQVSVRDAEEGISARLDVEGYPQEDTAERLRLALKEEASEFRAMPDFGCPFEIRIVSPGGIPRVGRTDKVRRIVDHRSGR